MGPTHYQATWRAPRVTSSDGSFQYTSDGSAYCVTATFGTVSYTATNTTSPTQGGCAGHGQSGVAAITNLAANPSVDADTSGWASVWGNSGMGTATRTSSVDQSGSASYRMTWSVAPTAATSGIWSVLRTDTQSAGGKTYTGSMYVRPSWSGTTFRMDIVPYDAANVYLGGVVTGPATIPAANAWTRIIMGATSIKV